MIPVPDNVMLEAQNSRTNQKSGIAPCRLSLLSPILTAATRAHAYPPEAWTKRQAVAVPYVESKRQRPTHIHHQPGDSKRGQNKPKHKIQRREMLPRLIYDIISYEEHRASNA